MNNTATYVLPIISDMEGHPITVSLESPLGSFVSLSTTQPYTLTFTPTLVSHIGLKTVTIKLTDTDNSTTDSFNIKIVNTLPKYYN